MENGNATRPRELPRESRLLTRPIPRIGPRRQSSRFPFSASSIFQGPLPPPEELARYEAALAGCAERTVSMAEEQAAHRRAIEARMIAEKLAAERRGQVFAFILVLVSMLVGGALIAFDKDISGLTAILGALASVVAIFVYGPQGCRGTAGEAVRLRLASTPAPVRRGSVGAGPFASREQSRGVQIVSTSPGGTVRMKLDVALVEAVDGAARSLGTTRSAYIRNALTDALERLRVEALALRPSARL